MARLPGGHDEQAVPVVAPCGLRAGGGLRTLYTAPDTWVAVYDLNDNGSIVWTHGTAPNTDEMSAFVPVPLDVPDAPSRRFRHADPGPLKPHAASTTS